MFADISRAGIVSIFGKVRKMSVCELLNFQAKKYRRYRYWCSKTKSRHYGPCPVSYRPW